MALAYDFHEDRTRTHGCEATREAAMAAFAKKLVGRQLAQCASSQAGAVRRVEGTAINRAETITVPSSERP